MSDIINVLTRKTSLRKACRDLQLADMEKLAETLAELIAERQQEEADRLEAQKQKLAKLEAIKKQIAESGIDISDLVESLDPAPAAKKPKGSVKPKYEIKDDKGEIHRWTGRGRTPKVFQAYFDKGGSKESCLIK
ncbi:H-NS family nucleoid-associated regulatory protein [Motiliproteus sediminis]|uniref:H-NS histone family protein n=1 Tax=Motiliproteus sediminis TaxID=1468178 RepID=UPI001AF02940|nr:H-NS family nucleoid-associated regulatory protein [Motiliproteus sediminis]